ncbi:MAG TPA: glycosyltransferase family A protein [Candidatus Limnocylindrales bacterium]|nr:glycosyltransferase family A protein [Candidatus Limnocylindrales bacterium]
MAAGIDVVFHVSCIIPAFNAERYLAAALDSALAQTRPPDQIVVVDDGSTDATAAVAAGYGARVVLLRQANAGPAAARNRGIAASAGDVLAFLDADDTWEPRKLELQLERLQQRPDLDYCVTMLRNFVSEELEDRRVRDPRLLEPIAGFSLTTLVVRRGAMERIGTFNEKLEHSDDTDWVLRASEAGAVHELLPHVLARRRLHDGNRSQHFGSQSRSEYLHLVKAALDRRRRGAGAGGSST